MERSQFPSGWDEESGRRVLAYYEGQPEEEAVSEKEATFEGPSQTIMEVPTDVVPAVRELLARHQT